MGSVVTVAAPSVSRRGQTQRTSWLRRGELPLLTGLAFLILGYHPWAEDGGLYLQGVELWLRPTLFPFSRGFVAPQLRYSAFAPLVGGLCRLLHLPLATVVLLLHGVTLLLLLAALRKLARVCWAERAEQQWAVTLAALWLGLPVAGTSLSLADPYLTARSVAFPCAVAGVAWCLEWSLAWSTGRRALRRLAWASGALLTAAALHPLVALCGAAACGGVLLQTGVRRLRGRLGRWSGALLLVLLVGAGLQTMAPAESEAYRAAALSRSYWYLSAWRWYELCGLVAPPLVLAWVAARQRGRALCELAWAMGGLTVVAAVLAAVFARVAAPSHLVASLQPMRVLQMVYAGMIVGLGGCLGRSARAWRGWAKMGVGALLGVPLVVAAGLPFPASSRYEAGPWGRSNAWVEAFRWVRDNTPQDALVALDADYITLPGEDAQSFRAVAERSSLPDRSKDGGEASIDPALAAAWMRGVRLQRGLSGESDGEWRSLRKDGVSWVVLQRSATTQLRCPFANAAVRVCQL